MGINDPILIIYSEKREKFVLKQGNETFYDLENYLVEFDTADEATEFALRELGILPQKEGEICSKPKTSQDPGQLSLDLGL